MRKILVIGGGVVGLSTAYYCAARGFHVTVIDRAPADYAGCSYGNAGLVVPSHIVPLAAPGMVARGLKWMWNRESPFYVKLRLSRELLDWGWKFWRAANPGHVERSAPLIRDLNFASRACFEEFSKLPANEFDFQCKGLLTLCKTQHALDEEAKVAAQAHALGMRADVLDAKQTAALDPDVRMDVAGAIFFPDDCHLSPSQFMAALKQLVEQAGVKILWNTEASGWRTAGNRIEALRTNKGEMTDDEYVLCGGAWSPTIARDLRLKIPIQAGKGYSLTLTNPRQLPRFPAIFTEARVAVTPMRGSLRFGGTMEIAGLNEDISPHRVRGIIKAVPRYYPEFSPQDFEGIEPWRGLRPCSPDGLPYIGRTRHYANLSIASGHAMMGFSLGPITGRIIAQILCGEKPSLNIELLDPDRYSD